MDTIIAGAGAVATLLYMAQKKLTINIWNTMRMKINWQYGKFIEHVLHKLSKEMDEKTYGLYG